MLARQAISGNLGTGPGNLGTGPENPWKIRKIPVIGSGSGTDAKLSLAVAFVPLVSFVPSKALQAIKKNCRRRPTLARASPALPSAMGPLTSVFGMGTGVTTPLWSPAKSRLNNVRMLEC